MKILGRQSLNTTNNQLFKRTEEKIFSVFIDLLKCQPVEKIAITELCRRSKINRSTFYAHYDDIYDLLKSIEKRMSIQATDLLRKSSIESPYEGFVCLFRFIKDHLDFYRAYLHNTDHMVAVNIIFDEESRIILSKQPESHEIKNRRESQYIFYFLTSGLTAMIKLWLYHHCEESPEEMAQLAQREFSKIIDFV